MEKIGGCVVGYDYFDGEIQKAHTHSTSELSIYYDYNNKGK